MDDDVSREGKEHREAFQRLIIGQVWSRVIYERRRNFVIPPGSMLLVKAFKIGAKIAFGQIIDYYVTYTTIIGI